MGEEEDQLLIQLLIDNYKDLQRRLSELKSYQK